MSQQRFGRRSTASMEPCSCQSEHKPFTSPRIGTGAIAGAGVLGSRSLEESLECPVCWECFNDCENTPYVLWCGHSLCKNCVLHLDWATVKLSGLPLHLPLFICCPWCQFLTFRFKWKGQLRYPCKNFFLLWIVESLQGELGRPPGGAEDTVGSPSLGLVALMFSRARGGVEQRQAAGGGGGGRAGSFGVPESSGGWSLMGWRRSGSRVVASFLQFTARIPLVLLFLVIVVYVLPISTLVLALYFLITVLFAVPSFLVVYFSYPSLDWLVRAIAS